MPAAELPKAYDPHDAQRRWYEFWLAQGYFTAPPIPKQPYCIVIPPPNVTGALHLGHALNNTLQDILIRWRRMQGRDVLWMPGTDHAGIATQAVVEKRLFEEEKKTRHDIGRDELVRRIWAWKDEYEARILTQLKMMGCSCDWTRTRFTLDEGCSNAVRQTFFNLFKAGKIFRGKRLVNWDTQLRTAVADDEIYTEEIKGKLWHIRYPIGGSDESLVVATTRPETMLGDTAVAVHPEDDRYRHLIGKHALLPLLDRKIPIIADALLVDRELGTGAVKVTPAHDPNDYACGIRNHLPRINLLNPEGTYNENAGPYAGLKIMEVRKRVVADLEARGLLLKTEDRLVPLKHSDRSKTPIEPYLSDQWFVRMGDNDDGSPGFAQQAMDAVTSGRIKIHPERYAKSYLDWLAEKRDWCISRQLWWGHRIPIWRLALGASAPDAEWNAAFQWSHIRELFDPGGDDFAVRVVDVATGESLVPGSDGRNDRDLLQECRGRDLEILVCMRGEGSNRDVEDRLSAAGFVADADVLDTWFSSALWPHSTLGWPEKTSELDGYYPTSVLSTARDIITLWVARMVIFGQFNIGDVPFHDVYIHPVIQDGQGRRMSKSAGNGVDPVDIIELFGADALRFALASLATETQDIRLPIEKVKLPDGRTVNSSERFEQARPFPNKLWNAARFALMNLDDYAPAPVRLDQLTVEDRWILSRLAQTANETTADLESFQFADAARRLREFTWNDFCDWYVEFVKNRLRDAAARPIAQRVLTTVLDGICRLLHPIVPFVTEQVWQALREVTPSRGIPEPVETAESVCVAQWPRYPDSWRDGNAEAIVSRWQETTRAINNLRGERKVPDRALIEPIIVTSGALDAELRLGEPYIRALCRARTVSIVTALADRPAEAAVAVLADCEIILPLHGLIDAEAETAKQRKLLADIDRQLGALEAKLANEGFLSRAPAEVVEQQRSKHSELLAQRAAIEALVGAK